MGKNDKDCVCAEIIYGINSNPPIYERISVAIQHLFAIVISIVLPSFIVCRAIGCTEEVVLYAACMSLIFSGIGTFIHAKTFGPFGTGLLNIQGINFVFVPIFILLGKDGGLPLILGMAFIGSFLGYIVAPLLYKLRKFFPPSVTGTMVMLIGLGLINIAVDSCAGGEIARKTGSYGSGINILMSFSVIILIILFQTFKSNFFKSGSILFGVLVSTIIFYRYIQPINIFDLISYVEIPVPYKYGMSFRFDMLPGILIVYFVSYIAAIGDISATSIISDNVSRGKKYAKRIRGGVFGDALTCSLSTLFSSFPTTIFAQNNGIIQLTGVASRSIGIVIGIILIILGFFPVFTKIFYVIPVPIMGGAMLMIFGVIVYIGVTLIAKDKLDRRTLLIVSVSIAFGLGFSESQLSDKMPLFIDAVCSSAFAIGGLSAFILNLCLPKNLSTKY